MNATARADVYRRQRGHDGPMTPRQLRRHRHKLHRDPRRAEATDSRTRPRPGSQEGTDMGTEPTEETQSYDESNEQAGADAAAEDAGDGAETQAEGTAASEGDAA
jgi:hypothetical protein